MLITSTACTGVMVIDIERQVDERGFFARSHCWHEFGEHGIVGHFAQSNVSHTRLRGTLRGMHYEPEESGESKLVRCTHGSIWDVVVDVRPWSPTRGVSVGFELSRSNARSLYIPPGCAHGFLTLEDDVDVLYQMGSPYRPGTGRGFRWDDPAFDIEWPSAPLSMSDRDASYPNYDSATSGSGRG